MKRLSPNLKYLKVYGCLSKVMPPYPKKRKTGSKTFDYMFIDYANNIVAYKIFVTNSDMIEHNTIVKQRMQNFLRISFL